MNKTKNRIGVGVIYLVIFAMYNLIVFLAFKERGETFWISYAFVTLAFILQIVSVILSFKTWEVEAVFFGIPLVSLSVYYLAVMTVVGLIFMIFRQVSIPLEIVIMVLITGVYIIVAVMSILARDGAKSASDKVTQKVAGIRTVGLELDLMAEQCTDPELRNKLRHLAQTVQYSDPMSNDSVANVEDRIMRKLYEMRTYIESGSMAEASEACAALEFLYIERNKRLAVSK